MSTVPERMNSIDALLDVARTQLGMDVAFVAEFTQGQRVIRHVSSTSSLDLPVGHADPLQESICQLIVDGRVPQAIPDARANPITAAMSVTTSSNIRAYVGVPVVFRDGRLYGTLCTFQHTPEPSLTSRDASVLSVVAKAVSELLEDEHAVQSKREAVRARIDSVLTAGGPRIVYQPIIDTHMNQMVGVEALSRFASTSGLSTEAWYLAAAEVDAEPEFELSAARSAVVVLDDFEGYLSLNLSARTICTPAAQHFLGGLPLDRVVVELTEHTHVPDYGVLASALRPLRSAGMRLAVDDAGAGFSSLQHILKLSADIIKLDRSLITGVEGDPARRALVRALLRFAEETGALVVAEGVETEAELAALAELEVRYIQGYLLGRPVPWAELRQHSLA
jgi:EAL domain-containing protein (putative c-di-GMP-specific phosphodiesterase class I)